MMSHNFHAVHFGYTLHSSIVVMDVDNCVCYHYLYVKHCWIGNILNNPLIKWTHICSDGM